MKAEDIIKDNLKLVISMVEKGSTDKEIAETLGISYSTFKRKKSENGSLKDAIAEGRDKKNESVEEALYKCCIGYKYTEEIIQKVKEEVLAEDGKTILVKESVKVTPVKKYRGPELAAQKYWLNNKKKTKWSEDPNRVANDKKLTKLKEKEVNSKAIL